MGCRTTEQSFCKAIHPRLKCGVLAYVGTNAVPESPALRVPPEKGLLQTRVTLTNSGARSEAPQHKVVGGSA